MTTPEQGGDAPEPTLDFPGSIFLGDGANHAAVETALVDLFHEVGVDLTLGDAEPDPEESPGPDAS